ncbi:MAG: hydrogenase expression/formation protein HypE [Acidobacteria bacterium]|nr:MAG: hydrogenase expression/formation protein HypE [Acidobacteriota bacterium]
MTFMSDTCPVPIGQYERVLMAHGGGGRLMHQLLERVIRPAFSNPLLDTGHDAAVLEMGGGVRIAFTTDSYVVRPLFFPGGDIGSLAVNGTVNDLAMAGAKPSFLSAAFIIEEGLAVSTLERVVASMREAAAAAGVEVVTGDTKVVDRGKGDGIYVNTAGIGVIGHLLTIAPASVTAGDAVVVSGDIGRHGMAIMAVREGLEFESTIESDCAPLAKPALALIEAGLDVHCLRDLTRGGLASALNEIAQGAGVGITLAERAVRVREDVRAACEILGFDPLYVANEGRFAAFVPAPQAARAVEVLQAHAACREAWIAGSVSADMPGRVVLHSVMGSRRIVDMLSGEQLPRIC